MKRRITMKKLFAIILAICLVFTLCSCKTADEVTSNNSSYSEPVHSSETSDTTSETEEPIVSETESSDDTSTIIESTPSETTSSKPIAETSSKEEVSKNETSQDLPKEPINFVPNDTKYYYNNVYYKGVKYACIMGKNNGVSCSAVVTLDSNDEYLNCVYVFDVKNNEQTIFNVHNDRIYFLQYVINDDRDYTLLNDYSICSVNLSGGNKKVEKKVSLPFTHISYKADYLNSKYLFFSVTNIFDSSYDVVYRYNTETNELTELKFKIGAHKTIYSVEQRVFIMDFETNEIYEHDIDLARLKFFYCVDDPHKVNSLGISLKENGFFLYHPEREDKYLLDFAGNLTKLS